MIRLVGLGIREARRNWAIDAALGAILAIGIVAQLWAVMSADVSADALRRYNLATFGEAQTWQISTDETTTTRLIALQELLARQSAEHPGVRVAAAGAMEVKLRVPGAPEPRPTSLLAVDEAWSRITSRPLRELLTADLPPNQVAVAWDGFAGPDVGGCLSLDDGASGAVFPVDGRGAGTEATATSTLCSVAPRTETNESLASEGYVIAGPDVERLRSPTVVLVTFVCPANTVPTCADLVTTSLRVTGLRASADPHRIDRSTRLQPLLEQRATDSERTANVVAAVAVSGVGLAAAIAASGRARRGALDRCLGATRAGVGLIAAAEGVVITLAVVGVCTLVLVGALQLAPDAFSSIDGIEARAVAPAPEDLRWLGVKLVALGLGTSIPAAVAAATRPLALE